MVPALHVVREVELHVVAEVVEAELVVGAVGDVAGVGDLPLLVVQVVLDDADRHAEEAVDPAHPLRVAPGQVVVDGDDVDALALERVQVGGQRGDERLAFAGLHLRDPAAVQDDAADQLHVEVPHVQRAAAGLADDGEASGSRSSSVSPLARRWRNSAVFAAQLLRRESAWISASLALISATSGRRRFSSRSFCGADDLREERIDDHSQNRTGIQRF